MGSVGDSGVDTVTVSARGVLVAPLAAGCCLVAGAAYVGTVDPDRGAFVPCPFRTLTGWWCPGCGLTRAVHHVLRGDLVQALRYNVFVLVVIGAAATAWALWLLRAVGRTRTHDARLAPIGDRATQTRLAQWVMVALIATMFGFAVVRNLPGVDGLRG